MRQKIKTKGDIFKDMKYQDKVQPESGNILFIILVAIALFGALSFAVSNMMRSGNAEAITEQKASILADEILAYARDIRQTVQNLRISNQCENEDISFENSTVSGYEHSPVARDECKVFHPDGGGLSYIQPTEEWLEPSNSGNLYYGEMFFTSGSCVYNIGTDNLSSPSSCNDVSNSAELTLMVLYVNETVCRALAEKTQTITPGDDIPTDDIAPWNLGDPKFTGTYVLPKQIYNNGGTDSSESLKGKPNGCFTTDDATNNVPSGTRVFYQVLLAR